MTSNISNRLRAAFEFRGLSIRRLSEISGVATSTIIRILRLSAGTGATLRKLAEALGIRPEWLIAGQGEMLPPGPPKEIQGQLDHPPVSVVLEAARQVDDYLARTVESPVLPGIRDSMATLVAGIMILRGPENPVPESYFATLYRELRNQHDHGQR